MNRWPYEALQRADRQWIDAEVEDTKYFLEAARGHVLTMKKILRRTTDPELEKERERELELALQDVRQYDEDLQALRTAQQHWDQKFLE